jgi:glycerophosphoryl diester phosphodiesterase
MGARWVEFDVQISRDECPILLHDARLERTTNGRGRAANLAAAELARLDAGAWFDAAYRGECVPRLDDAMALLETLGMGAVVEVKSAPGTGERTMRATLEVLRGRAENGACMVASFDEEALALALALAPEIPRALNVKSVPSDWRQRLEQLGCCALHADQRKLDARTSAVVAAEVPLRAYTVNAPERAWALFSWGVSAVFTDCPDVIISRDGQFSASPVAAGMRGSQKK